MPADCLVGHRQEPLMRTFAALNLGLLANASDPFIAANRLIACLARLAALKAAGISTFTATEESPEQSNFCFRGRPMIDSAVVWCIGHGGGYLPGHLYGVLQVRRIYSARFHE